MTYKKYTKMWFQHSSHKMIFLWVIYLCGLAACGEEKTTLDNIRKSGELRFVTVESPLTYFKGSDGTEQGLEFELASMFAESLGLKLNLIVADSKHEIVSLIKNHKAYIGSAALALSDYPDNTLQYGPAYIRAKRQLVYHYKNRRPKSIQYLNEDEIAINEDESYQALSKTLSFYHPDLAWRVLENKSMKEILRLVNDNTVPVAIADSNWVAMYRYLYPEIRVAFDITKDLPVAWIYLRSEDATLDQAVRRFFKIIKKNGALDKLIDRYYQHTESFDYVDTRTLIESIDTRLPEYKRFFKASASKTGLDWLLLAALSYQESHWKPMAKSPTGVRGMMMLTQGTAESLGVDDRLDPEQSILGGARYLNRMLGRLPERIQGEDRIWLALAAYNVGYGHLEDARRLTQAQGGDPDTWLDVSQYLPLLADEDWHRDTRHGHARGGEPVHFVRNIQRYYDILKWKNADMEKTAERNRKRKNKKVPIVNSWAL